MLDDLKTLEEARKNKYGKWAGNPKGYKYKEGMCAYKCWRTWTSHQCSRKNGYGINGLYCKQHAKRIGD